jgi:hypothetical protein
MGAPKIMRVAPGVGPVYPNTHDQNYKRIKRYGLERAQLDHGSRLPDFGWGIKGQRSTAWKTGFPSLTSHLLESYHGNFFAE